MGGKLFSHYEREQTIGQEQCLGQLITKKCDKFLVKLSSDGWMNVGYFCKCTFRISQARAATLAMIGSFMHA